MPPWCRTICILAFLGYGCGSGSFYVEPSADEPANLFQSSHVFSHEAGSMKAVIRSARDWEELLDNYPTENLEYARDRFWRVDYNRHMVLGIALGSRWSGSIRVNIDSLRVENQHMIVYATEFRPSVQTRDFANPAHFIVTERTNLPVEFADVVVSIE